MEDSEEDEEAFRKWLFDAVARRRGEPRLGPADVLAEAAQAGHELSVARLGRILEHEGRWTGGVHPVVLQFIRAYLGGRRAKRAIDPAAYSPLLLLDLVDGDVAMEGTGWVVELDLLRFVEEATKALGRSTEWVQGNLLPPDGNTVTDIAEEVDLIVCTPPFGMKPQTATYPSPGGTIEVRDEAGAHAALSAARLTDKGEALVLAPPRFFWAKQPRGARAALARLGLHVHAAIELRDGLMRTSVHPTLLSIRKMPVDATWVGQLRAGMDVTELVQRWRDRRTDSAPELGRLTPWEDFTGFEALKGRETLSRLAKRSGSPEVALAELLTETVTGPDKRSKNVIADPSENTVYLPTFANATTHDSSTAEGLKAGGYVRLVLDPERVHAGYLAAFFSRPHGLALRAAWSGGSTLPTLRLAALADARIPLPPLAEQTRALRALQKVKELRVELAGAEAKLIDRPTHARDIERQLERLGQSDPLKSWVEDLPFPLGSVLWRARAGDEQNAKLDHLLRFFEASAEFFATVLLSGFYRHQPVLDSERLKWGREPGIGPSLQTSSFGGWTYLGAAMAGSARRVFTGDGGAPALPDALGVGSKPFASFVAGKELWKLLADQVPRRNAEAHRGIRSPAAGEALLTDLQGAVTELHAISADALAGVRLVRPREGALRKGINEYKAQFLTGYTEQFPVHSLHSIPQLEADELYVVDEVDPEEPLTTALQLLPLVTLRSAPQGSTSAVYFYSRIEGAQAKYVSHHFEDEATVEEDAPALGELLRDLAEGPGPAETASD